MIPDGISSHSTTDHLSLTHPTRFQDLFAIPISRQELFLLTLTYHPYIKRALVIGKGALLCSNLIPVPCSSWRFSKHSLISPVSHWVSVLCGRALYACELLAFYPVSLMALILFPFGRTREWREENLIMQHRKKRCSCMSDRLELKPSDRIPREIFQEESTNSLDVDIAGLSGRNSQAEKESYLALKGKPTARDYLRKCLESPSVPKSCRTTMASSG